MARRHNRKDIAATLIGLGLVLGLAPIFTGSSPASAAFKPWAPFGWLAFAVGCGMVWRRLRGQTATAKHAPPQRARPSPVNVGVVSDPPTRREAQKGGQHLARPPGWNAAVFEVIEWRRFEAVVEALFAQAGFETKTQSHGADEGIDIWLYSSNNPGAPVSVVQCKHWQGKRVGVDKVRELRGVMAAKNLSRGQFATTSTFTSEAAGFAKGNGINLLDVQALLALIATRTPVQQEALLAVALEGEYWKPTCVNCGIKMVERTRRNGGSTFWGCRSYPNCKTTMAMRQAPI